ncbi:MAG: PEP-CTERM sorting domain-containing protein [Sphingomonas sp.]|nr:PEP-CTERM sorting domain-containing protein [Sphingomonas sp.]
MHKLVLGLVGATALAFGSAASATVTIDSSTMNVGGPNIFGDSIRIDYNDSGMTDPFTETLTFTNSDPGLYVITLVSSFAQVNFTSAILTGPGGPLALSLDSDDGTTERWLSPETGLIAGTYTLTINGTTGPDGVMGGHIDIAAVPEPATWAMMFLGFGAVGYALRRRRRPVLAQAA